eukprot:6482727-Amphidinium_carterae.1
MPPANCDRADGVQWGPTAGRGAIQMSALPTMCRVVTSSVAGCAVNKVRRHEDPSSPFLRFEYQERDA